MYACVCEINWSPHMTSRNTEKYWSAHMTSHNTGISEINWSPHILRGLISAFHKQAVCIYQALLRIVAYKVGLGNESPFFTRVWLVVVYLPFYTTCMHHTNMYTHIVWCRQFIPSCHHVLQGWEEQDEVEEHGNSMCWWICENGPGWSGIYVEF